MWIAITLLAAGMSHCTGCARPHEPPARDAPIYHVENLDLVDLGMTPEEVLALCGPPDSRILEDAFEEWWYFGPDGPTVRIAGGKVTMVRHPHHLHEDKVAK